MKKILTILTFAMLIATAAAGQTRADSIARVRTKLALISMQERPMLHDALDLLADSSLLKQLPAADFAPQLFLDTAAAPASLFVTPTLYDVAMEFVCRQADPDLARQMLHSWRAFHTGDSCLMLAMDTRLQKLYGNNIDSLRTAISRYSHIDCPLLARLYFMLGFNILYRSGRPDHFAEATPWFQYAVDHYPDAPASQHCRQALDFITGPAVDLAIQSDPLPESSPSQAIARCRNTDTLYLRVVDHTDQRTLRSRWQQPVGTPTQQYGDTMVTIDLPPLEAGYYLLEASSTPDFIKGTVCTCHFQCCDAELKLTSLRPRRGNLVRATYTLVNRRTGKPIRGHTLTVEDLITNIKIQARTDRHGRVKVTADLDEMGYYNIQVTTEYHGVMVNDHTDLIRFDSETDTKGRTRWVLDEDSLETIRPSMVTGSFNSATSRPTPPDTYGYHIRPSKF